MMSDSDTLLSHLPADGLTKGNVSLRESLGWNESRYEAARDLLISAGLAEKGRGRGGSLRRLEAVSVSQPAGVDTLRNSREGLFAHSYESAAPAADEEAKLVTPAVVFSHDSSINFAFQQNAIPVIKELRLINDAQDRRNLSIKITSDPGFAIAAEIRIHSLRAGEEFRMAPVDVKLSPDFLSTLNEKVVGCLKVEVFEGETLMTFATKELSLLARNEWAGVESLPEIIAAFVLPNDPAVMQILDKASTLLRESTGRSALNGYQDKNRQRAWEQVAAIYKAIERLGIRYINPPASFETTGQKVRFPTDILAQKFGTCLDLSLLFCACCEQAGLRSILLMHQGHAYAGCWLEEKEFEQPVCDDLQQIRNLEKLHLLTVVESTLLAGDDPVGMLEAERLGRQHLVTELPFRAAIDVRAARKSAIKPLPVPGASIVIQPPPGKPDGDDSSKDDKRDIPGRIEISQEQKKLTRIDLWKTKLLDLSLRNKLLNFKETKATVRILSSAPEHVEDSLAAQRELALLSMPRPMRDTDPRSAAIYSKQQKEDMLAVHLTEELNASRLHTGLDDSEHSRRLTDIYRASRTAIEENGTNTLFAAVGILEWRETEHGDKVHRAPLLLVPVELRRKSVVEGFTLRRIDEDTRVNVTLLEMLRQHFQKEIKGLDPLPEDDSGVNVGRVFDIFREAVLGMKGWEVKSEIWLGQFSFTKFLLWKDLEDRLETLTANRVVDHLVNSAGTPYTNEGEDIRPSDLDARYHPREIFCPRSADSSQLAAVMAAASGQDFVLEGPPGTGKSQTITNIIAHCLSQGKRVLFVAEKRAALDVVHRRLKEDGLEPFCLELHSNKVGKTDVLQQFDKTLKLIPETSSEDWHDRTEVVAKSRETLNAYAKALHNRYACGLSAFHCLDYILPRKDRPIARWKSWAGLLELNSAELERMRSVAATLGERLPMVAPVSTNPLASIGFSDWTPAWEEQSKDALERLRSTNIAATAAKDELCSWIGLPGTLSKDRLGRVNDFVDTLLAPEPVGAMFVTAPWKALSEKITAWTKLAEERGVLRSSLNSVQNAGTSTLPCERWTDTDASSVARSGRALLSLVGQFSQSTEAYADWLGAPKGRISREALGALARLAECLLAPLPVAAPFLTTRWNELVSFLDSWIKLVEERTRIRTVLNGYDEPTLLYALDLEDLDRRWQASKSSWFLMKWLRVGHVRRKLKSARPDRVKPTVEQIDELLASAIRLKQINGMLDAAHDKAALFLGEVWSGGNPDAEQLKSARLWGQSLHERIVECAECTDLSVTHLQALLATCFQQGVVSFSPGTKLGDMLRRYCEQHRSFSEAQDAFVIEASLESGVFSNPPGYLNTVNTVVATFLSEFDRLREINAGLLLDGAEARSTLSSLWNDGEPSSEILRRAQAWGERFHSRMLKCADDDLPWLSTARTRLSVMFGEGVESFSGDTKTGTRLRNYTDAQSAVKAAGEDFVRAVRFEATALDGAADYHDAVASCVRRIADSCSRIRHWCAWQHVRHEALSLNLAPVIEMIESEGNQTEDVVSLFEASFRNALFRAILETEKTLRFFFGHEHSQRIIRFRDIDDKLARLTRAVIRKKLEENIPPTTGSASGGNRKNWGPHLENALVSLTSNYIAHGALNKACGVARDTLEDLCARGLATKLTRDGVECYRRNQVSDYPKEEIGLLNRELAKKTKHIPVRQLLAKMPNLLPRLKPCVLMSPLSVAQYLDPEHSPFDVVIFDEASQIPVWDAIGAIARGKQLIVVGDPKQLPPTNFFANAGDGGDGDGDDGAAAALGAQPDLESILDELMANGLRHKRLKWHYRSRHEGLITFSNRQYYENDLLTFPSPASKEGGVRFVHLPNARYDKGKSRTNRGEAIALVEELVARLAAPTTQRRSYGIVTFSQAQQELIEDLLDEKRREHPEIEVHFGENPPVDGESVFVKNLENVQGDERDVIFFSIGYGVDEAGKVSMNFGPLNKEGGHRRLNVAITRAKHEVVVFSGLRGDQIDLTRTRARGVKDLKLFLDYAERGPKALPAAISVTGHEEPDSEFERMVADRIRAAGYEVHHQVGCSGYRIDLGVVDPDTPGRFLLGIECDGATYHRAATARDRDKLRQQILEGLGWSLHRIWSTDWWHDADKQIDRLLAAIEAKRVRSIAK